MLRQGARRRPGLPKQTRRAARALGRWRRARACRRFCSGASSSARRARLARAIRPTRCTRCGRRPSARPGRIKADIPVDLPHPRPYTIKTTPEFVALKERLVEEIRAEVDAVLAEVPSIDADRADLDGVDIDEVGRRLEDAHQILVRALESVEKG